MSRSTSNVPTPPSRNFSATKLLRGLRRLLPLPCANSTTPRAFGGSSSMPSRKPVSAEIWISWLKEAFIASPSSLAVERGVMCGRAAQEINDFVVARLIELLVPDADGAKRLGCVEADHFVDKSRQFVAAVRRRHRDGDDDSLRMFAAHRLHGHHHRRTGSKAVIDEYRSAAAERQRRRAAPITRFSASDFLQLGADDLIDRCVIDPSQCNDVAIENAQSAARDGAHRELLVRWNAELAHDDHVEVDMQTLRDRIADRNAAAG